MVNYLTTISIDFQSSHQDKTVKTNLVEVETSVARSCRQGMTSVTRALFFSVVRITNKADIGASNIRR
jgi:hypothetical protein